MVEHNPFRHTGRAGRVDDGGEVIGPYLGEKFIKIIYLRGIGPFGLYVDERHGPAIIRRKKIGVEKDEPLEALNGADGIFGVFPKLLAGNKEHAGAGILEDIADLIDGLSGVNRDVNGPEREDGEIGKRPLGAILRDDGDAVAGSDAHP